MGTLNRCPRFIFRNIVLHLLAFAVVVFALQAKLALYKKAPEPGIAAAKLSTEKNSSKVFAALGKLQPSKVQHLTLASSPVELLAHCDAAPAALPAHSALISLLSSTRLRNQGISLFPSIPHHHSFNAPLATLPWLPDLVPVFVRTVERTVATMCDGLGEFHV